MAAAGATRELAGPPPLLPLYLRVALPRPGGGAVPDTALRLTGVRPSVDHVAAYARLCGFPLGRALPLTYPSLLGLPLQLALMADRRFPFPAAGLVHLANRWEQHGAVPLGAPLDVTVRAEGPRPHRRGLTVDLLTEVAGAGRTRWTSRSTYLRRRPGGPGGPPPADRPAEPPAGLPTTAVWRLPADLGRRYAAVSGDRNPIHLWALTARPFGFPRAIAQGMWTAAACVAAVQGRLPEAVTVEVRYGAPVLLPSTVELGSEVAPDRAEFVLRSPYGRVHLTGRATARGGGRFSGAAT